MNLARTSSVRPTYRCSAASARGSQRSWRPAAIASCNTLLDSTARRFRWSRPRWREGTFWWGAWAREDMTSGATAQVACQVACSAAKTSGERNIIRPPGARAKRASTGRRCNQSGRPRRARPDGCPRGRPNRTERRQATWPPRYNHLHLGGPVRARQSGTSSIHGPGAIPAARSPIPHPRRNPAQTTL